jgi:arginase
VLWLDAHADFNTPATSPSGNMHGMSAALLAGEPGLEAVFGDEPRAPIEPRQLHLFGVRSLDRGERELLRARGINVIDMRLIDEFGVGVLLRRVLDKVAAAKGLLHVSLDVDFMDPSLAPGVGTTVPGGATFREAHLVMELLHDSGLVASLDVVELNPFLDVRGPQRAAPRRPHRQPLRPPDHRARNRARPHGVTAWTASTQAHVSRARGNEERIVVADRILWCCPN